VFGMLCMKMQLSIIRLFGTRLRRDSELPHHATNYAIYWSKLHHTKDDGHSRCLKFQGLLHLC